MGRRAKPAKGIGRESQRSLVRKSSEEPSHQAGDLEKRLAQALEREADALKREAEALGKFQTRDRELAEALERQIATAEILRAISQSPADFQPVFETILVQAVHLCAAEYAAVFRFDGSMIHFVASYNLPARDLESVKREYPMSPTRSKLSGRAILSRGVQQVADILADAAYEPTQQALEFGVRSILAVPMVSLGEPVGAVLIYRRQIGVFPDDQVALLKTFADQAVIAIQNVRLFTELEARNKELRVALEQQTATSEILRVISSTPTDVQPVFDAIARHGVALCGGVGGLVVRYDGAVMRLAAGYNVSTTSRELHEAEYPRVPDRTVPLGAAILDRTIVHVPDLQASTQFAGSPVQRSGRGSMIAVPLLREGEAIGAIGIGREQPESFSDRDIVLLRAFADQAVIAIENARMFTELQEKNKALTEAHAQVTESLEQQTATSEILKVISRSAFDLQPVFDTMAENAVRLCEAERAFIFRFDGERLRAAASYNAGPEVKEFVYRNPVALGRHSISARAALERRTVHVPDVQADPDYTYAARDVDLIRTLLAVPMLKGDTLVGTITIYRLEVKPFTDKQVALVETFAAQAVIAIENVQLFKELQEKNRALTQANGQVTEALDQQTATSEILRTIAHAQTDAQPVFDTIVRSVARLCRAAHAAVFLTDGRMVYLPANLEALATERAPYPRPLDMETIPGIAILTRSVIHVPDTEEPSAIALVREVGRLRGFRSSVAVPMLRDGQPVGTINVARREPGRFSDSEVALLKTFADQAVIAIENVRLFTELQEKNNALTAANAQVTESLEQQTATSEVLKVISASTFDLQPVLDILVENATRLCAAKQGFLWRFDGELFRIAASYGHSVQVREFWQRNPIRPGRGSVTGRAALERRTVHIPDILADPEYQVPDGQTVGGYRTLLGVPMLREGVLVGVFGLQRAEVKPFTDKQIELVTTFADQAVIAIENTRLLKELEARTAELTRSVTELTALGEVSRALSSTLDLDRVLQTIVTRASQLAGTDACSVFEYDEASETFHLRATNNLDEEVVTLARQTLTRKGEGVQGRMAVTRQPVQVADIAAEDAYHGPLRDVLLRTGTRAVLAIPMLRENELIGGLTVNKRTPGEFTPEVIELLTTFATQSALAIQNARLFREIDDKSHQLEVASQHKSEFLANMSHELRTPLNAILGFSEILAQGMFGAVNDKQSEYLQDILESGRHLLSLINDILDLSKVEAGKMELEVTDFDLPSAIDNALTLVRERVTRRGITLGRAIDDRAGLIQGDERKVKQVLLNLLSNAIKFTPEGGHIEARAVIQDGLVEVSVIDTGVGIAPEDQEVVFEEFRQVGTADKKVEGTGLGLALCRKFVELHGGRIWVKSEVGQGSTFTFTLPARREG